MIKRIVEIIILVITVFSVPSIIILAFNEFYLQNTFLIWRSTAGLAILLTILTLQPKLNPALNRTLRTIRFYVLQTRNIAIFLSIQLVVILTTIVLKTGPELDVKNALLSFGINILVLNLLVVVGRIPNTDKKQLLLHNLNDGKVYLQTGSKLRYIPDPPTFDLLGLNWSELIDINDKDLERYTIIAPVPSIGDIKLVNYRGRVYGIVNEKLKHVPNPATLQYILKFRVNKGVENRDNIRGFEIDTPFANMA